MNKNFPFRRDTTSWIKAIDLMRSLQPLVMVPQHTRPIAGEKIIMDTLTAYRDAIQFVRDQTIRYMNKGLIFPIYGFQTYFFDILVRGG